MSNYSTPGIYMNDLKSSSKSNAPQADSSIGILIGVNRSGPVGEPVLISSFPEYLNTFAYGLDTAFMDDSFLPNSVYGFYANGGEKVYVLGVRSSTGAKAQSTGDLTVVAKYEGEWGNDLTLKFTKSDDYTAENLLFDVEVSTKYLTLSVEGVTKETLENVLLSDPKISKLIESLTMTPEYVLVEGTITLSGGADGISDLADTDFTNALVNLDLIEDAVMFAIPAETASSVIDAMAMYGEAHRLMPIFDTPIGTLPTSVKTLRSTLDAKGDLVYPWGVINDPLISGAKMFVPSSGYYMGVVARTIKERGSHKAPAGTEANIKGFVDLEYRLSPTEHGVLNKAGVSCMISKPNYGIIMFGARSTSSDSDFTYVSDILLNYNLKMKLNNDTFPLLFEPNGDDSLWSRAEGICKGILENFRLQGALKGTKDEAYFVTCNETNNSEASVNSGELNITIGYAPKKPAEFIIFNIAHSVNA